MELKLFGKDGLARKRGVPSGCQGILGAGVGERG